MNIMFKSWDKKQKIYIDQEVDLDEQPSIDHYIESCNLSEYIYKVGDIIHSDRHKSEYRVTGDEHIKKHQQWAYILVIDNKVVKCGNTITTLIDRWGSYRAGHDGNRTSGTCSTTNYYISELVRTSHKMGLTVELYGYAIPQQLTSADIFGTKKECVINIVSDYESELINRFYDTYGYKPVAGPNGMKK